MHNADHGYYFLTPRTHGSMDWCINEFPGWHIDGIRGWPLFMFETTDGGKSWNQISTNTFRITKYIEVLKLASPQVGILTSRNIGWGDLCDLTYLTVDGGLNWYQIPLWSKDLINWSLE